ncbi:hypothetical protein QPK87_35965 [Kamptonema cortianum]|nr:hypothetical protein [Kamptonema cortianum]
MEAQNDHRWLRYYPARQCWKVEIPARRTGTGRKLRRFFTTKLEAERAIAKLEKQLMVAGLIPESPKAGPRTSRRTRSRGETVGDRALEYADYKRPKVGPGQNKNIACYLGKFTEEFGSEDIRDIKGRDIQKWVDRLPYQSQNTRAGIFAVVRSFFNWAERWDYIETNPVRKVEPVRWNLGGLEIFTPEQLARMLDYAHNEPDRVRARKHVPKTGKAGQMIFLPFLTLSCFAGINHKSPGQAWA